MASGAGRLLDDAMVAEDVAGAVGDCSFVFATTARDRDLTKAVYTPEAAMAEAVERGARGERVAVLFGPERAGLENDDVARASAIVQVPTNPDFPSLNLAQCVLLMGYEWRRAATGAGGVAMEMAGTDWVSRAELDALARHYEERLEEAGFFFPAGKAPAMKRTLRNMWARLPLTRADAQVFHGMLRQMVRWKERG
jgi:tRNA/rRNA methyltransferase